MKKLLLIAAICISASAFATGPTEKVLESFNKTFTHAKDVSWQEIEKNYEASFTQNEIMHRVQYDDHGNILRSIRYYKGQMLPIFIQARLQKKYEGKNVYSVTEVTTPGELSYHIILEDEKHWIHVNSDAYGNVSLQKKIIKA